MNDKLGGFGSQYRDPFEYNQRTCLAWLKISTIVLRNEQTSSLMSTGTPNIQLLIFFLNHILVFLLVLARKVLGMYVA